MNLKPLHTTTTCMITLAALCLTLPACTRAEQTDPQPAVTEQNGPTTGMPQIPAVSLWPNMTSIEATPVFPQRRDAQGRLLAELDVESLVNRVLTVQYRIDWLDSQGQSLTPNGKFKMLNFPMGASQRVQETDPTGKATTWRAEFRPVEFRQRVYQP